VQYALPPSCSQLLFDKTGSNAAKIRAQWVAQDDCFSADGERLSNRHPECNLARFTISASTDKISGYPAAYPMADSVYLHTSNYHVDDSCGAVSYQFEAPYLALEGKQEQAIAKIITKGDYTFPVLLSTSALKTNANVISYIDTSLSKTTVNRINEVSEQTIAYLKHAMPKTQFAMPIIVAANIKAAGSSGVDGDAGNVLRLGLLNWPDSMSEQDNRLLTMFVSHEFSHRFQLRDAVDIYPQARLIHEGGAEFLRWLTAVRLGWMTPQVAAADLDKALGQCFLQMGDAIWGSLSKAYIGNHHLEYRCGLPLYVYGLAARQNKRNALANFEDFYQRVKSGSNPDFDDAIECGDNLDCHPKWLQQLLGTHKSMQAVWREMLHSTGLAKVVAANQAQKDLMVKQAFSQLMIDDCGSSSYFEASDGLIVDAVKTCKTLSADMKVTGIEGHKLFGNKHVLPTLVHSCQSNAQVTLNLADGVDLKLACKTPFKAIKQFYAVDIEKVLRSLN
jgi:hypothetical protein